MGILTQEKFVEAITSSDEKVKSAVFAEYHSAARVFRNYFNYTTNKYEFPEVDVEAARTMYNDIREQVLLSGNTGGKVFRPYLWTPVTEMGLDPNQPWWGFEFETGYASPTAMSKALGYCWDNFDNVTFDAEGEGNYFSEVTFAPDNMEAYLNKEASAYRYIKYLSDNSELAYNSGYKDVGTHINISIPSMRNPNPPTSSELYSPSGEVYGLLSAIHQALNLSLQAITMQQEQELFGRAPVYGGFYLNGDGKGNYWFEGKVFRTTYKIEEFDKYVTVAEGITKCILALEAEPQYFVKNFYEVLKDPSAPVIGGTQEDYVTARQLRNEMEASFVDNNTSYEDDGDWYDDDFCDCSECVAAREEEDY